MSRNFEHPKIIGVIGKKLDHPKIRKILKLDGSYVILPFKVGPKYLKNLLLCMKLMDIEAMVVMKPYQKHVFKILKKHDAKAKQNKAVNYILRKKTDFFGSFIDLG